MRSLTILSALSLFATLQLSSGCAAPEGDELDTAAEDLDDTASDLEGDDGDDDASGDEVAIPWAATHRYCITDGSADSGWAFSGGASYYDFGRGKITWSGSSVDGVGSITVNGNLYGVTYGALPDTIALTGAVYVNGGWCKNVSVVDRDGNSNASASGTCTASWSGSGASTTVKLQDSSKGARFEFIRGGVNDQFYGLTSGSSLNYCWTA